MGWRKRDTYDVLQKEYKEGEQLLKTLFRQFGRRCNLTFLNHPFMPYDGLAISTTVPNGVTTTVPITEAEEAWNSAGQWIEWEVEVRKTDIII